MEKLNFKGLNCPLPVINTRRFLTDNPDAESVEVVVDNKPASQNVKKFLEYQHFMTSINEKDGEYSITASKTEQNETSECLAISPNEPAGTSTKNTLVMITHDCMGTGDKELGTKLMSNFILTLAEMEGVLWRIILVNEGVKLVKKGTTTVEPLKTLEGKGISLLVCGTCLEYFDLTDKTGAGEVTNMLDIVTSLEVAEKVINY